MTRDRLSAAIVRSLREIGLARCERAAIGGMVAANTEHGWAFFRIAEMALFNDMLAHAIKVLDRNSQSAGFWYVFRCLEPTLRPALEGMGVVLEEIERLAGRLRNVRNQTHFHIDRDAVREPSAVWRQASITANELARVLDAVWQVLLHAHRVNLGADFEAPVYDGSDITQILVAAEAQRLLLRRR